MKKRNVCSVILLATLLSGCAGSDLKPTTKIDNESVIRLKSGGIVKTHNLSLLETDIQIPTDTELRVITKGDTSIAVGGKIASFVAVALLGGDVSQSTFKKSDLKGSRINSVENPSGGYFLPAMNKIIEDDLHVNNYADYQNYAVTIMPTDFYLVYTELAGSDDYELHYAMNVSTPYPGKYNFNCSFTSGGYPLEEWSASEYKKVKDTMKLKVDECLARFSEQSNLIALASDLEKIRKESSDDSKQM